MFFFIHHISILSSSLYVFNTRTFSLYQSSSNLLVCLFFFLVIYVISTIVVQFVLFRFFGYLETATYLTSVLFHFQSVPSTSISYFTRFTFLDFLIRKFLCFFVLQCLFANSLFISMFTSHCLLFFWKASSFILFIVRLLWTTSLTCTRICTTSMNSQWPNHMISEKNKIFDTYLFDFSTEPFII